MKRLSVGGASLGMRFYTGKAFPERYRNAVFIAGWMSNELAWGRPADVLVMPDGSLLVSDDHAGAIYRITYCGQR